MSNSDLNAGWWSVVVAACVGLSGCGQSTAPSPSAEEKAPEKTTFASLSAPLTTPRPAEHPTSSVDVMEELARANGPEAKTVVAEAYAAKFSQDELIRNIRGMSSQPWSDKQFLLRAMLKKLAAQAPVMAMQLALEKDPKAETKGLARDVAQEWAKTDYAAVYEYSQTLETRMLRERIAIPAVEAWAAVDPAGAFEYFSGLPFEKGGIMIGIAAREFTKKDPNAALAALDKIKDSQGWDYAASNITETIARRDPAQAMALLFDQDDPRAATPMAYALGSVLAETSVKDGIDVLNRIQNIGVANHFLHGMIHKLNKGDMSELMASAPAITDPTIRGFAAMSMGSDAASVNPSQAVTWLSVWRDDEKSRQQAYQGVGMGYAKSDPVAAQAWLNSLPAGADRRYAIFGFASQYARAQPEVALSWAMQIAENDVRERLLRSVLSTWSSRDADAARNWAAQTGNLGLIRQN